MTDEPTGLTDDELQIDDAPRIVWLLLRDCINLLWKQNPKRHDIGKLAESITQYGFRDPAAYDGTLQAIIYGNGRIEAAWFLEQQSKPDDVPPRGIARQKDTGHWAIPVFFGIDSDSELMARRFAIDHNNLTLSGGDYAAYEYTNMWDEEPYLDMLRELAAANMATIALDADDIVRLFDEPPVTDEELPTEQQWVVMIECADEAQQVELLERFIAEGLSCRALTL